MAARLECTGKSEKVTMPSSWMSEAMKVEKPMEKPSEKNIRVRGIERMGSGIKHSGQGRPGYESGS